MLAGGINRRMSVKSRPYAVFPFVTDPSAPVSSDQIAMTNSEFWGPLWTHPATITETRSMLRRGLARIGNRTAGSPHEFAVAALAAGTDVGIESFARFELRQTTSSQVYEAIPKPKVQVRLNQSTASELLLEVLGKGWLDRMPFEPRDSKQRGKFVGLRGPIEAAIVEIAESPTESERWRTMLLRMSDAQAKIDRNQKFRKQCFRIPTLSRKWFHNAWGDDFPREIEVARAIASVGADTEKPLLRNLFGVEFGKLKFPKVRPSQAVWNTGDPLENLLNVAHRRLIDTKAGDPSPLTGVCTCSAATVAAFIRDELDMELVACWIPPLSLIDWSDPFVHNAPLAPACSPSGEELLHGLLRPLFHCVTIGKLLKRSDITNDDAQLPKAALLRKVFHLLRYHQVDEAVSLASRLYRSYRLSIVVPPSLDLQGDRIAAALLIPMRTSEVASGLQRWLLPEREKSN